MQTQMFPADGNEVISLYHEEDPEHSSNTSTECEQCGCEIANVLRYLQVGIEGNLCTTVQEKTNAKGVSKFH